MKILVCISNVPDTTSKINFTDENGLLIIKESLISSIQMMNLD